MKEKGCVQIKSRKSEQKGETNRNQKISREKGTYLGIGKRSNSGESAWENSARKSKKIDISALSSDLLKGSKRTDQEV